MPRPSNDGAYYFRFYLFYVIFLVIWKDIF